MLRLLATFLIAFALAAPAQARWRKSESEHFVVYADDSAKDLARFSDMLERYHSALEYVSNQQLKPPSPSNRVTIYAVGSSSQIEDLTGSKRIAGFYVPRASGSIAFVQDVRPSSGALDFSMVVLLHEYAHHFFYATTPVSMPRWLSEGWAEFHASAQFPKDGGVALGRPALHRGAELAYSRSVPIEIMFDDRQYNEWQNREHDDFYGRSWMLFHYLRFEPARKGQLTAYLTMLLEGAEPLQAAKDAFGDLNALDKELAAYRRNRRWTYYNVPPEYLQPGPVNVYELSDGMNAVLPLMITSKRGVDREQAQALLPEIQAVAAQFPDDADVLAALAEAEHDAGNDAAAIAAADRAIAANPATKNAYVQKAYSLFRLAEDAEDPDAAYNAAMAPFAALNRLENDHPLPLIYHFRSFAERGREPDENARHAIERASELAPFDKGLSMTVAHLHADEGKIAMARNRLAFLAADPHLSGFSRMARAYYEALEGAEEGKPFNLTQVSLPEEQPEDTSDGGEAG